MSRYGRALTPDRTPQTPPARQTLVPLVPPPSSRSTTTMDDQQARALTNTIRDFLTHLCDMEPVVKRLEDALEEAGFDRDDNPIAKPELRTLVNAAIAQDPRLRTMYERLEAAKNDPDASIFGN